MWQWLIFGLRIHAGEPKFLSPADKMQSVNVTEGDQVRLPCRVTAEPVADIVFLRNGVPLECKSDIFLLFTLTGAFMLSLSCKLCYIMNRYSLSDYTVTSR